VPMDDRLSITPEPADSPVAQALIRELDAELHRRYPASSIHGFDPAEIANGKGVFLVARVARQPVGCGAIRPLQPGVGEVKRMFVTPGSRGQGIARRILAELERRAADCGFHTLRLETGHAQPEAIRLYRTAGYQDIARYGEYENDPHSVCFEKYLARGSQQNPDN
jgi:putative acetyltransferase